MNGPTNLLDFLEPDPDETAGLTDMAGTFINPPHPDALHAAKKAHFQQCNVYRGTWRPYRGWAESYGRTGAGSPHVAQFFSADLRCRHLVAAPCHCVGDLLYRVYCAGCDWWTGIHDRENAATEEHLDHCWPGWRELPVIESTMKPDGSYKYAVPKDYPESWAMSGAPTRDCRGLTKYATRHAPGCNQFGGVKTAVIRECEQHKGDT